MLSEGENNVSEKKSNGIRKSSAGKFLQLNTDKKRNLCSRNHCNLF